MKETKRKVSFSNHVFDTEGNVVTVKDLPPVNDTYWTWRKKATVVAAVNGGLLDLDQARRRYAMSIEEFASWQETWGKKNQPNSNVRNSKSVSGRRR